MIITASDFVFYDNGIWFVSNEIPFLIHADMKTGQIIEKIYLNIDCFLYRDFYARLLIHGSIIIGLPYWATEVLFYDIKKRELTLKKMPIIATNQCQGYYAYSLYDRKLFAFSRYYFDDLKEYHINILEVNLDDNTIINKQLSLMGENTKAGDYACYRSSAQIGRYLYLCSGVDNTILKFDSQSFTIKKIQLGALGSVFTTIICIDNKNNKFLIADNENRIVLWDEIKNEVDVFPINVLGFKTEKWDKMQEGFSFMIKKNDKVILFPYCSNMVVEFNIVNKHMHNILQDITVDYSENEYMSMIKKYGSDQFSEPYFVGEIFYVFNRWKKELYRGSIEDNNFSKLSFDLELSKKESMVLFDNLLKFSGIIFEDDSRQLAHFIDYCCL